ncbi:glycosyltransferase [Aquibaculum sediminis]|uniref:glycosyltransferase n=1 Tax=Aquibaculum sediminis TaxID=3231907 RepID=UPI003453E6F5
MRVSESVWAAMLLHEIQYTLLFLFLFAFCSSTVVIFLSSLEDALLDGLWLLARLQGRLPAPAAVAPNTRTAQRPLAVLVPAWDEAEVLPQSLGHFLSSARYEHFRVFVGYYPNDPATREVLEGLAVEDERILPVSTGEPGPTSKAHCLNAVLAEILAWEARNGLRFAGFVLQDAEDVSHADALAHFDSLLHDYDLIQLPVFPMVERTRHLVGGHYLDEFAEKHAQEAPLRGLLSGVVPGAGVATAYGREALLTVARANQGDAFRIGMLTEDYELSHRLANEGTRQIFLRRLAGPGPGLNTCQDLLGTREIFPHSFSASLRQKTRWILGNVFQGWEHIGWRGRIAQRYFLYRDRKILLCGPAAFFSIAGLLYTGLADFVARTAPAYAQPPLLPPEDPLWLLAYANLGFLLYRLAIRHLWVAALHGWRQALPVLLRYVVGTVINYLALGRASLQYFKHKITGEPLGWDKTRHHFPRSVSHQPESPPPKNAPPIARGNTVRAAAAAR